MGSMTKSTESTEIPIPGNTAQKCSITFPWVQSLTIKYSVFMED